MTLDTTRALRLLLAAGLALSCARASGTVEAPVPVADTTPIGAQPATLADASFMRDMIGHHAQALAMTRLVRERTNALDIRTLAERIARSQQDEIGLMAAWLRARGQPVPDTTHLAMGHHVEGQHAPGMLSGAQLDSLRAARGGHFDRLFLTFMIRHHRGALEMVRQLLSRPGGGQDPEAGRFAADVDADQRAEIARMERMLAARGAEGSPRDGD